MSPDLSILLGVLTFVFLVLAFAASVVMVVALILTGRVRARREEAQFDYELAQLIAESDDRC